jgi:hypothetical protein
MLVFNKLFDYIVTSNLIIATDFIYNLIDAFYLRSDKYRSLDKLLKRIVFYKFV